MSRILFYLNYAARNLRRSTRWTTFAIFCIGAGVATVVALRSLGLAIGDSLIDNVRQNLHGDVRVGFDSLGGLQVFSFGDDDGEYFSAEDIQAIEAVAGEYGGKATFFQSLAGMQVTRIDAVTVGRPQFVSAYLIDPETFPPTEPIFAQDPAGVPLADLFTGGNEIVISRNLADQNNIRVGDRVRVSGTTEEFIVRGIVPTYIESGVTNLFASFFGFAYIDIANADVLQVEVRPNIASFTIEGDYDPLEVRSSLREQIGYSTDVDTTIELIEDYTIVSDYLGRFIVIMGLGALLIGGVGIINTMLVMVGRRTAEIAALKTFGLKGRQVFWLFMSEAFLLGILGSIVGCILGVVLSVFVNQFGEAVLQQGLTWRLYPEALLYGLGLGMIVTLVFGVLPILTANKVRPATILRPNETAIPRTGVFHSIIALALVVIVIGGVAGRIIGDIPLSRDGSRVFPGVLVGMGGVGITLIIMGLLVMVFWVIVWLVSRFPSFGIVDMRLALRNMTARRVRTATTLLALTAGMFALSAITFVGVGTREILQISLSQSLGGNVMVMPLLGVVSPGLAQGLLDAQLNNIDGIQYRTQISNISAELRTIDGVQPEIELPFEMEGGGQRPPRRFLYSLQLAIRESDNPNFAATLLEGRMLTPEDEGKQVMVVPESFLTRYSNVTPRVGSMIELLVNSRRYEFEIVGITTNPGSVVGGFAEYVIPAGSVQGGEVFPLTVLQTEPDKLNQVLLDLSTVPFVFALDVTFIDSFLGRLIDQFAAIPTLVGLLSLLAAAVTMANTVSLATLERRRQIGILKAVGLKGRRVLTIMLIENTIIGLLGGLLGIGLSALIVALMTSFGVGISIPIPRDAAPLAIALILASVVIAFVSTFLSASVATREPVTSVLRYE